MQEGYSRSLDKTFNKLSESFKRDCTINKEGQSERVATSSKYGLLILVKLKR